MNPEQRYIVSRFDALNIALREAGIVSWQVSAQIDHDGRVLDVELVAIPAHPAV